MTKKIQLQATKTGAAALKRIIAEVWFYWALRVSHTKPESRHFSVEAARRKAAKLNYGLSEVRYVVMVLQNGAFVPDTES